MIKVFLVEDEVIIRKGVKNSIHWNEHNMEFVGEASDGELAYPLIKKEKPDILITDIKMPFMDGLELSRMVKKELPDTKIIILSGYNEFEYAKEAITIGVTEYLLKPISADKLLTSLIQISETIEIEKMQKEHLENDEQDIKERVEYDKTGLFNRVMTGTMTMSEIVEAGSVFHKNLGAGAYNVLLFKISNRHREQEYTEQMIKASNDLERLEVQRMDVFCCRRGIEGWGFLLSAEDEEQVKELTDEIREKLKSIMTQYGQLEFFGGSGKPVLRMSEIATCFAEADKVFALRYAYDDSTIVSAEDTGRYFCEEALDIKSLCSMKQKREMIQKFLNIGTEEETASFVKMYFESIPDGNLESMLMRQYIIMDIYVSASAFAEKIEISDEDYNRDWDTFRKNINEVNSPEDVKVFVSELLHKMIGYRDGIREHQYRDLVEDAKNYIHKNYMTENISLNSVASYVNVSPSYFSSIFGKEAGQTFIEYLTAVRMEKAKELMMCSNMKMSEISFEVGYKDPHYFSYLFKKMESCSPKEYRSRGKIQKDDK